MKLIYSQSPTYGCYLVPLSYSYNLLISKYSNLRSSNDDKKSCLINNNIFSFFQAALVVDRETMAVLIERIEIHAPDTAKGMQALVDSFQFGRIRDLLGDAT